MGRQIPMGNGLLALLNGKKIMKERKKERNKYRTEKRATRAFSPAAFFALEYLLAMDSTHCQLDEQLEFAVWSATTGTYTTNGEHLSSVLAWFSTGTGLPVRTYQHTWTTYDVQRKNSIVIAAPLPREEV